MVARRSDALAEMEATKWKIMFCGQEECWRTDRIAAIDPRIVEKESKMRKEMKRERGSFWFNIWRCFGGNVERKGRILRCCFEKV
ncbi:hypothetical protein AgCh_014942 [Apium graveolens]